ncbi:MAG: DUF3846 domain-containing protein [Gammaproteobacteria bacterium]|nr:DUF3846 domain-containing protein [Gammaproteobacteria bacterium]
MSITIIKADGTITQPTNEERLRMTMRNGVLEFLQHAVKGPNQPKGWIEVVRLRAVPPKHRDAAQMIVNEEGLLLQLPVNCIGTFLYAAICNWKPETPIAGNIVLLTGEDTLD